MHENKVKDLIERLNDLVATTKAVMYHAFGRSNDQPGVRSIPEAEDFKWRLDLVHNSLLKVKRILEHK